MNIIDQYEAKQIANYVSTKKIPEFKAGDSVRVSVKVTEGASERLQSYEGIVIARRNHGLTSSFIVRKISHGQGVERRFMLYSPLVQTIEVVKYGIVRRAKLFYLRNRSGKSARIREKINYAPKAKAR
ncbi:MAG: 50S ribosomal protein L19 [Rickettsiaceae bacterium]|nr:MAG: 50S ribosomal protein L19 [Rickettsiaceae bacterium]